MDSILIGYDGSNSSKRALDFAFDLARHYGAHLHVVAVARPPEFGTEVETEAIVEQSRKHYQKLLTSLKARFGEGPVDFHVAIGHPAEQLVRFAEQNHIEHIVVGHRGGTAFERWLIGSVARQVVAYAPCAVTVVRR
jgi:nucleotide-binding universal stress UspA family protein